MVRKKTKNQSIPLQISSLAIHSLAVLRANAAFLHQTHIVMPKRDFLGTRSMSDSRHTRWELMIESTRYFAFGKKKPYLPHADVFCSQYIGCGNCTDQVRMNICMISSLSSFLFKIYSSLLADWNRPESIHQYNISLPLWVWSFCFFSLALPLFHSCLNLGSIISKLVSRQRYGPCLLFQRCRHCFLQWYVCFVACVSSHHPPPRQAFDPNDYDPYTCSAVSPGWTAAILYVTSLVVVACLLFIYHQLSKTSEATFAGDEDTPIVPTHGNWNISCLFVWDHISVLMAAASSWDWMQGLFNEQTSSTLDLLRCCGITSRRVLFFRTTSHSRLMNYYYYYFHHPGMHVCDGVMEIRCNNLVRVVAASLFGNPIVFLSISSMTHRLPTASGLLGLPVFIFFVSSSNKSLWVESLVVVAAVWTWAICLVKQHLTIIDLVQKTVWFSLLCCFIVGGVELMGEKKKKTKST